MSTQRQFLLGLFFLTALSILGFYTLFLTDFTLFGDQTRWQVNFPEAHGLREGDPVLVAGMRIGRVKELEFDPGAEEAQRIKTVLLLEEDVELLMGARITIKESSFLGGRHVDIYPGESGGPPLEQRPDEPLLGTIERNPIAALGDVGDLLGENRESVRRFLTNIAQMSDDMLAGKGTLGRAMYDEQLARDVSDAVASMRDAAQNVSELTAEVRRGQGVLGGLIYDPEMLADLQATVDGLRAIADDVRAGRGVAGRLVYDEELARDLSGAMDSIAGLFQKLERGEGALGMLLSDPQFATDLRETVSNVRSASADIQRVAAQVSNGEGSLGRLLTDDEVYDELLQAVQLITRSLEDYREAAPISAFTGVLFSAF